MSEPQESEPTEESCEIPVELVEIHEAIAFAQAVEDEDDG